MTVTVLIMGREYSVTCPAEEHEALVTSAEFLNERMTAIRRRGKALGSERIAVMAALNIARELLRIKGEPAVFSKDTDPAASRRIRQMAADIDSTMASTS